MQYFHHPPNHHAVSENVIGTVVQRRQPVHHSFFVGVGLGIHAELKQQNCNDEPNRKQSRQISLSGGICSTIRRPLTMQEIDAITDQDTQRELRIILKQRRDRRKIIQQRHHKKKQKMVGHLVASIPKLRNEIEQLQLQRLSLMEKLRNDNVWSVAIEYSSLFQCGKPELRASQMRACNFLTASMSPDLDTGITSGIEALMKRWKTFTRLFPSGHIQLENLRQLTSDSLVATTSTSVTLTEHVLQHLFQHGSDDGKAHSIRRGRVFSRLQGQHIVMRGSVRFGWDEGAKRVVRLYFQTDILTPMLGLLGNLEDVSFIFSGALITPDGHFVHEYASQHQ
ncbi:hypothetical protein F441_07293 [Phytophthora nicotianae CJ01A1]|uniref:BZIP domain-containing protein n=3 Tax=Phytophthora nicotianae TaxID=4792 RepID=W2X6W0_PHYNI|nr:hypothetical protein F441_07293 [Phytophthora nicotianae CJ01A1]